MQFRNARDETMETNETNSADRVLLIGLLPNATLSADPTPRNSSHPRARPCKAVLHFSARLLTVSLRSR